MNSRLQFALFAVTLIVTGCAKGSSSGIASSEIYASLKITGDSTSSVKCSAEFQHGGPIGGTYLELSNGDKVTCSDGTTQVEMKKEESFVGSIAYVGTGLSYGTGKTYTVTFTRGSGESFVSSMALPEPIAFVTGQNASSQKGAALAFQWTGATSNGVSVTFAWSSGGSSATRAYGSQPDNGNYTIPGADTTTPNVSGNVPATITLTREKTGTHPSGIKGSSKSEQTGVLNVTLN